MIVRQLCVRQGRQLLALNRQSPRILTRFYSSEPPVENPLATTFAEPFTQSESAPLEPGSQPDDAAAKSITQASRNAFITRQKQQENFNKLGSSVAGAYEPENLIRNPPRPSDISLELLLANQTHLGHSTSRWNPQNSRYIFGIRDGIHIISLDITAAYLRRATKVVEEVAARGGLILFVGTRRGQKRYVVRAAELADAYHVFERWIPGSLTNGQQILGHCETKAVNAVDEELPQYQEALENRPVLKPDLVVCLNPLENTVLLQECALNNVPTIGIIDTDANPTLVTYPIPSNDDSLRAVGLIAGVMGRAAQAGQKRRLEQARRGNLTYEAVELPRENPKPSAISLQPETEAKPEPSPESQPSPPRKEGEQE